MNVLRESWGKIRGALLRRAFRVLTAIEVAGERAHSDHLLRRAKSCGPGTRIWGRASISGIQNVNLGKNVHIGAGAFIRAEGGLSIGDNTHISRNLLLYTVNHSYEGTRLPYDESVIHKEVRIGRNVWIGMNVCIAPGTEVGDGAIVGMGTVVTGFVPPLAIIGGQKWRIIGRRDSGRYEELENNRSYGGPSGVRFDDSTFR